MTLPVDPKSQDNSNLHAVFRIKGGQVTPSPQDDSPLQMANYLGTGSNPHMIMELSANGPTGTLTKLTTAIKAAFLMPHRLAMAGVLGMSMMSKILETITVQLQFRAIIKP